VTALLEINRRPAFALFRRATEWLKNEALNAATPPSGNLEEARLLFSPNKNIRDHMKIRLTIEPLLRSAAQKSR